MNYFLDRDHLMLRCYLCVSIFYQFHINSIQFDWFDYRLCVCIYIVLWKIQSDLNFSKKKINIIKCFGQSSLFEIAPFNSEKKCQIGFRSFISFLFCFIILQFIQSSSLRLNWGEKIKYILPGIWFCC